MSTKLPHTSEQRHLKRPELVLLLSDDDSNEHACAAAEHLETCHECQALLTTLAADENWWTDAHTLLNEECPPRWQPDLSCAALSGDDIPHDADAAARAVRELLETPRHPEMFGRLGRYDIEHVIGHGGMGIVVKAHDSELNRPIAIKLLAGHLAHVGAARERFAREGRAAAAVVHEHVVGIYNVESTGKVPFLVMQYVPGRSLQLRVDEDGPLSTEEILRIGMQAASGLSAAHRQGLVHRDVKPSNILLENTVERALLTDFGLARTFDDASLTHTGILAGTPHYMSPEQASGEPIDQRSDLFSLGAVLYFMATGHPPFRAASAMAVLNRICRDKHRPVWQRNRDIPDALSDVIDRLLEKKPSKRFATAEEVQQHLAGLLSRSQQHGLGRRRFRGLHDLRWRGRAILGAVALALVATIATVIVLPGDPQKSPTDSPAQADAKSPVNEQAPPISATYYQTIVPNEARLLTDEQVFIGDFNATASYLGRSTADSYFLKTGNDLWRHELKALERDLDRFESNQ